MLFDASRVFIQPRACHGSLPTDVKGLVKTWPLQVSGGSHIIIQQHDLPLTQGGSVSSSFVMKTQGGDLRMHVPVMLSQQQQCHQRQH